MSLEHWLCFTPTKRNLLFAFIGPDRTVCAFIVKESEGVGLCLHHIKKVAKVAVTDRIEGYQKVEY